jgi:hypothetical protein
MYGHYGWLPWPWGEAVNCMWEIWGNPTKERYLPVKRGRSYFPLPPDCDRARSA